MFMHKLGNLVRKNPRGTEFFQLAIVMVIVVLAMIPAFDGLRAALADGFGEIIDSLEQHLGVN